MTISRGAEAFGAAIKRKGLSQRAAGELIGVSQAHITDLLLGKKRPSLKLAYAIKRVYAVRMEWWVS